MDQKIYPEYGEKTVDLLLKIGPYKDLAKSESGQPIPKAFNEELIDYVDRLAAEAFTGETEETRAARLAAGESNVKDVEHSSCKAQCTGLCVGCCVGMCNGCGGGCTSSCGTGCAGGLMVYSH